MSVHTPTQRTMHSGKPSLPTANREPIAPPNRSALAKLAIPLTFAILGILALTVDVPLARWFESQKLPGFVKKAFELSEVFGHGTGVAAILLCVWFLAPAQRRQLPRIICCTYLAGLTADAMKLLLSRGRPYKTDWTTINSVWQTFRGWFPLLNGGSGAQSFTSAHTATAVGLAIGLAWAFPRGRWLFAGFALLVALQRMSGPYHFLSDTLWGAAIGSLIALACLPGGWLSSPFDRLEKSLSAA
jgi:membrane-associated phospholipid phosphatase